MGRAREWMCYASQTGQAGGSCCSDEDGVAVPSGRGAAHDMDRHVC